MNKDLLENLPHYWRMKNCLPFRFLDSTIRHPRIIYVIMFFDRKRALLYARKYDLLGQMETRYAKKRLKEAQERKWVGESWENYGLPVRPEGYPDKCEIAYWIDAGQNTNKQICL